MPTCGHRQTFPLGYSLLARNAASLRRKGTDSLREKVYLGACFWLPSLSKYLPLSHIQGSTPPAVL